MRIRGIRHGAAVMAVAVAMAGAAAVSNAAYADAIHVTSTADDGPDMLLPDTLRQALAVAVDGDTIDATGITGTITLMSGMTSSAELRIDRSITIVGPGPASLTVDANHLSRVFHITPGHTVAIEGIRIVHGVATGATPANGGGILNDHSTLGLRNCALEGNSAEGGGGLASDGSASGSASLTVIDCLLTGNSAFGGGGIFNTAFDSGDASLTVITSTLDRNSAFGGGGIYNEGESSGTAKLTVIASTLSGNSADSLFGQGGGIVSDGSGQGHAFVRIHGSTLSGNSAGNVGGAIDDNSSVVQISSSTFSGNTVGRFGGGIFVEAGADPASLEIGNTILRAGAPGENIFNDDGTVVSHGFNLSSDDGGSYLTATGDQIETDPKLGPLQDNGGPTFTHLPLSGSPAIDQGLSNTIGSLATGTDQRGSSRTIDDSNIANAFLGDGTDIGSVEVAVPNHGPVALCKPVTVLAGAGGKAQASIDDGSFDPDSGDTIVLVQDPSGPYSIGATSVTLTVTDSHGESSECSATVTVTGVADLSISKAVVSGQAKPGQILTYTLVVNNLGPNAATGVVVTDPVPQGTTFGNASPAPSSAPPAGAGGTVTWSVGDVASGASVTLTLTVKISLKGNALIVNTATVGSGSFDPALANNTVTVTSKRNTK
ncbi:MAG: DUF11 domain-containing protein [Acidobacteria bacterium]|nr:DUF11 domain-containing protein [Acidobacteriota bacterium]